LVRNSGQRKDWFAPSRERLSVLDRLGNLHSAISVKVEVPLNEIPSVFFDKLVPDVSAKAFAKDGDTFVLVEVAVEVSDFD